MQERYFVVDTVYAAPLNLPADRETMMAIYENLTSFFGKPVIDFRRAGDVADFAATAPRLRCDYDDPETLHDHLAVLLDQPGIEALEALVFGMWMENGESFEVSPQPATEQLVSARDRIPKLRALFIGDIISEENEISWIGQGDHSAIWAAFPKLEHFGARGANGLRLGRVDHEKLTTLVIESGGLPSAVVREALAAKAPLQHLELWLGDENYGADTSVRDFVDLLAGKLFPELKTLALRDCQYADDLAEALAEAPILDRIERLDLSLGTLTDRGARALLASPKLSQLQRLSISHHYVSAELVVRLQSAGPFVEADDPQQPDNWDGETHYHVAVSE